MAGSVYNRGTKHAPNWWAKYKDHHGVWRAKASGQTTKESAERWLAAIVANVANGRVGIYEPTEAQRDQATVTLQKLLDRFMAEYRGPNLKDAAEYHKQTSAVFNVRILPQLGPRAAASITSVDVEKMRDDLLADDYAPGSVGFTMARLSKVYEWGKRQGLVSCDNPVKGVEYPETKATIDYLSHDEATGLLVHAEEHERDLYPMIATLLYTGLRKGEAFGLRWRDINFDNGKIFVCRSYDGETKSGDDRLVPLNPNLAPVLRRWRERCPKTDADLVFPVWDLCDGKHRMGVRGDMLRIEAVLKAAKCHSPSRPWHMLRHTFASHFIMAGGNILTLQKLLGHADLKTTMIYAHLAPDFMADEVAKMTFVPRLATVTKMEPSSEVATNQLRDSDAQTVTADAR